MSKALRLALYISVEHPWEAGSCSSTRDLPGAERCAGAARDPAAACGCDAGGAPAPAAELGFTQHPRVRGDQPAPPLASRMRNALANACLGCRGGACRAVAGAKRSPSAPAESRRPPTGHAGPSQPPSSELAGLFSVLLGEDVLSPRRSCPPSVATCPADAGWGLRLAQLCGIPAR